MQITHQAYYTDKLAKATTVKQGSVRGQIYDASGKPQEMWEKQVLTLRAIVNDGTRNARDS